MGEEIAFENGRISDFQWPVTLTLDRVILHTVMHHSSTSTYVQNFIEIKETFCGQTDVRMDRLADGHLRPTLLGRLGGVDLKTDFNAQRQNGFLRHLDSLLWPWPSESNWVISMGGYEYSRSVLSTVLKPFTRYRGNKIWPNDEHDELTAWKHNSFGDTIGWWNHKNIIIIIWTARLWSWWYSFVHNQWPMNFQQTHCVLSAHLVPHHLTFLSRLGYAPSLIDTTTSDTHRINSKDIRITGVVRDVTWSWVQRQLCSVSQDSSSDATKFTTRTATINTRVMITDTTG